MLNILMALSDAPDKRRSSKTSFLVSRLMIPSVRVADISYSEARCCSLDNLDRRFRWCLTGKYIFISTYPS